MFDSLKNLKIISKPFILICVNKNIIKDLVSILILIKKKLIFNNSVNKIKNF
jgi:hypothetical protein